MTIKQAVLDTLRYSYQFNFPLTSKEVHKYLIYNQKVGYKIILSTLNELKAKGKIQELNGFYSLRVSPTLVKNRMESKKTYKKALNRAKKDLYFFKKIFFVKFVGITGSVAAKNLSPYYDIDLFFVFEKNFLWIGRFVAWFYLRYKKKYRLPYCPNILISNDSLTWKTKNIYIANEIARMIPLINKDNTYEMFLNKNRWILNYLPNFAYFIPRLKPFAKKNLYSFMFFPIECLFFLVQYLYMFPKITTESISFKQILFFKNDYSKKILNNFYQST